MHRLEYVFGGVLFLFVIVAIGVVMMKGGSHPKPPIGSPYDVATDQVEFVGFTGNANNDLCTCYEQAFEYARLSKTITSSQYQGGYSSCLSRLGQNGARAWTDGWTNGGMGRNNLKTCRRYFATLGR